MESCSNLARTASSMNTDRSPLRPASAKYRRTRRFTSSDTVKVQRADCFMVPPRRQTNVLSHSSFSVFPFIFKHLIKFPQEIEWLTQILQQLVYCGHQS